MPIGLEALFQVEIVRGFFRVSCELQFRPNGSVRSKGRDGSIPVALSAVGFLLNHT